MEIIGLVLLILLAIVIMVVVNILFELFSFVIPFIAFTLFIFGVIIGSWTAIKNTYIVYNQIYRTRR